MTSLALHGVRGGLGRSALLAALGYALQGVGERVLLIDLCPSNLLGLHFNLALGTQEGWALAERQGRPVGDAVYEVLDGLCLLPFGNLPDGVARPCPTRRHGARVRPSWPGISTGVVRPAATAA